MNGTGGMAKEDWNRRNGKKGLGQEDWNRRNGTGMVPEEWRAVQVQIPQRRGSRQQRKANSGDALE